jgi:hypothetical protein
MFYFHLTNEQTVGDIDGTDLPNIDAAWAHALAVARELTSHSSGLLGHAWSDLTMSVCDAEGKELFSFPMSRVADQDEPVRRFGNGHGRSRRH